MGRMALAVFLAAIAVAPVARAKDDYCGTGQYRDAQGHCVGKRPNVTVRPPGHMNASPGPVRAQCPPHNRMGPHGCRPY